MNKKKAGLLIIVLFLIIGLGSFVFANPDNQENFEEGDIEERDGQGSDRDGDRVDSDSLDVEESTSDTLLTDESDSQLSDGVGITTRGNNLTGFGNNGTLPETGFTPGPSDEVVVEYDYYADALKAVENAESSLVQGDVDYAASLVDLVTNQSQKDELNNRLEAVQDIIDVTTLIERLEEMVANSTNRDGIVESITYRDDENIEELVNDLTNDSVKDALAERLETVNKILNDNESPVISGIDNNSFTKKDVSLTISDTNEVTTTVTLNGEEVDYTDSFTEEGTYVVTVVDAAFNETTLTFTIDKTKPVVGGVEDGKYYNSDVAVTIDDTNPGTIHLHKDGELVKPYNSGDTITEEGTYTVVVTDKAGNKSNEITFVIDKTNPEVLNITQEYQDKEDGRIKVTITTSEEIYGNCVNKSQWRKVGENTYVNYYYRTKEVTIAATDKAGNPLNYTFIVDMDAPVVKSLGITDINEFKDEVGKLYAKNGDTVRVLIYFDEKLGTEPTVKLGGKEFTATYRNQSSRPEDNHYAYYADIKLTEDMNLSDGVLPFEVYGYADEVGNVGVKLTEANINSETYPSVTIDNTKAEVVDLLFHSSNENNQYAKPGDWFGVYLIVNEQLKENPTFIVNGVEYTANQFEENGGNYKYAVVYEIPANTKVGEMTFEISNIVDLAGNVSDNLSNSDTDMSITYDNVSPGPKILGITGFFNENEDAHYITYGKKIRVLTYYNEKLGTNPIVKIGNKEFETYYTEKSSDPKNNSYAYYADITITEDLGLSDGVIPFTVYGHKDLAGNEGRAYTNADVTYNEKQEYDKRYDKVILDNTMPSITGFTDNFYNNKNEIVYVSDNNLYEVTINGTKYDHDGKYFEKKLTKEGTYTVVATDKAGNTATKTVTIDKTAPEVVVTKSNNDKSINKNVIVTITADEDIVVEDGWQKTSDTIYTKEYSENGKYSVVVKDRAGNETTVNFEVKRIDKVAPTAVITKSNNDKSTNQDVVVTLVSDEAIYRPEGWTEVKTNKEHEFTKTYTENGKYSVVIKDKAGNETTVNFEVKRIDRVAPEITVVDPNKYYLEAGEEYVDKGYSAYDVVDKDVTNLVKISYQFQAKGSNNWEVVDSLDTTKLGVYKLTYTAYDKAGNTAKGTRVVAIRDTKAPEFIGLEDGGVYNPATIQVNDATLKTITVFSEDSNNVMKVENGYVIDEAGSYEISAVDQEGHETTINIKVDTKMPTYTFNDGTIEYNNIYGTLNLKLHDENGIASVVINGTQLPHTGYYVDINDGDAYTFQDGTNTVVVTDAAGNTVTYTFIVDKTAPTYSFNGGTTESNGVYGTLNLKLHDENGIASVVINGVQLPHKGYYVDINDGDAYTFQDGINTVVVTDNLGNTETYTFVVDKKSPTYSFNEGTIESDGTYENLCLKLHDENGIASVVINGVQLPHKGYYVDINDGDAYTFQDGINTVVVTDNLGNTETYEFNVVK